MNFVNCKHFLSECHKKNQNMAEVFRIAHLDASSRQSCNMIRCISKDTMDFSLHVQLLRHSHVRRRRLFLGIARILSLPGSLFPSELLKKRPLDGILK